MPDFPILILPDPQIYTNADTYKVFAMQDFEVNLAVGDAANLEILFRYTQTQGRTWSPWAPMTAANLQKAKFDRMKFVNFEFSFKNLQTAELRLNDLNLIGEFINVSANYQTTAKFGLKTQCHPGEECQTCKDGSCEECQNINPIITPWSELGQGDNCSSGKCDGSKFVNLNDPNLWMRQINTYNELNKFINAANSWKVTYYLTDPDGKGIDHVLHEQTLHNYIVHKDIQVIVPNNQFPVENVNFTNLDFDLIQTFEVHILKDDFKKLFGVEFRPSKKDVLYMCALNQLWEIEQMLPHRGFMLAEVYWRVILKKYSDRKGRTAANTAAGQSAQDSIDALVKYSSLDSLFGIDVKNDIKKGTKDILTAPGTTQQYTPTSEMKTRSNMTKNSIITTDPIQNSSLLVSKSCYQIAIKSKDVHTVEYIPTDRRLGLADNRAISFWFKTTDFNPDWDYTVFNNYDSANSLGYMIHIVNNTLLFTLNDNTFTLPLPGFEANIWYAFLINVDQVQRNVELAVYKRQAEDGSTLSNSQLVLFNKLIIPCTPDEFIHTQNMYIGGCNTQVSQGNRNYWMITNIRIYTALVPVNATQRQNALNENVVTDSQFTILVDNAEEQLILPKYGNL